MDRFADSQRELACWLALHQVPGIGPKTVLRLLTQFATPEHVLLNPNQASSLSARSLQGIKSPDWDKVETTLHWFETRENCHIITLHDPRYPKLLKQIADPPAILFVQGDVSLLSQWQLAIVGSRNPSASGRDTAYEFARYLARGEMTITSGLAIGIDAAAHQGALASKGHTVAVIGTGLDQVYPARHQDLAQQIAETGLIVTEYALGTTPRAENFPRRNRIISGLSLGTLVVEAALQSGSLITARMAMEQGREVFAIPGSIHNPLARGCHALIRQGAKLVETADDIIEELSALAHVNIPDDPPRQSAAGAMPPQAAEDEEYQILFEHLGYDPIAIDELIARSGLTAEAISSMLLLLELQGKVVSYAGGRYARAGQ